MKRYDSYKDSGVKWLGEIPSHWEVKHLRNFLTLFSEKGYGNSQLLSVTREKGVILRDKENKEENHNYVPDDLSGYKHLHRGDFAINKMKSWQGSYGVSDYDGIVSPAYFTCKLSGVNPKFFSRAIRSKAYVGFFMQYSKGIRVDQWDLDPNSMKDIPFVLPLEDEQEAIANYLDAATSKIDEAIAQQQKMIDLLNERKQIIINNAVTKGLDPNVKMKPSGIDWIGMIPEGWEVLRIKNLISLLTDYDANGSFSDIAKNCNINVGVPFAWMVRTTDLVNKRYGIVDGNNFCDQKTYNYLAKSSLCSGDLLMTKRGNVGNVYVVPDCDQPMTLAPNLYLLRTLKNKVNNKYLMYYLSSSKPQGQLALLNKSTTLGALYKDDVKGLNVVIPPLNVQNILVDWIEKKCHDVDAAIDNIKKQISLLQERKQIIINDVVTGKVKVV